MCQNKSAGLAGCGLGGTGSVFGAEVFIYQSRANLGPVYMEKSTSPARPGADRRDKFQSLFI